jgi:hypothetical protein
MKINDGPTAGKFLVNTSGKMPYTDASWAAASANIHLVPSSEIVYKYWGVEWYDSATLGLEEGTVYINGGKIPQVGDTVTEVWVDVPKNPATSGPPSGPAYVILSWELPDGMDISVPLTDETSATAAADPKPGLLRLSFSNS